MTPNALIQSLAHREVELAAAEALAWRKRGVLQGETLRGIAGRFIAEAGVEEAEAIRLADSLIIEEAATRYVAHI